MTDATISVVGTLAGVILGFVLTALWSWRQQASTEKRQKNTALRLASLEIEHNLTELKTYWGKVFELQPEREELYQRDPTFKFLDLSRRLITLPIPMWKHSVWDNHMGVLSAAIEETRVIGVYELHAKLDSLATIRDRLVGLAHEQDVELATPRTANMLSFPQRIFDLNAPPLWAQCEEMAEELLEAGNPLNPGAAL